MQHWTARPRPEAKQLEGRFVRLERPLAAARDHAAAAARRSPKRLLVMERRILRQ